MTSEHIHINRSVDVDLTAKLFSVQCSLWNKQLIHLRTKFLQMYVFHILTYQFLDLSECLSKQFNVSLWICFSKFISRVQSFALCLSWSWPKTSRSWKLSYTSKTVQNQMFFSSKKKLMNSFPFRKYQCDIFKPVPLGAAFIYNFFYGFIHHSCSLIIHVVYIPNTCNFHHKECV